MEEQLKEYMELRHVPENLLHQYPVRGVIKSFESYQAARFYLELLPTLGQIPTYQEIVRQFLAHVQHTDDINYDDLGEFLRPSTSFQAPDWSHIYNTYSNRLRNNLRSTASKERSSHAKLDALIDNLEGWVAEDPDTVLYHITLFIRVGILLQLTRYSDLRNTLEPVVVTIQTELKQLSRHPPSL